MSAQGCGSVSAISLGLPPATAVPEGRGELPRQIFYAKRPVSARLRQRFANDLAAVDMLALLRPANTGLAEGQATKEILVMGLKLTCQDPPLEIVDHIAAMRSSGIIFVCVRPALDKEGGPTGGEECALAVRRPLPAKPGHERIYRDFASPWRPAGKTRLTLAGDDLDQAWEGLNAQVILDSSDGSDVDGRIARRAQVADLVAQEAKLAKDHARAKDATQRNQAYAKLHKVRTQLKELGALDGLDEA
ncbi:DUF4391 domain-containing protein [Bifidobacterium xylocopae]|uniref:DUF4391 domain-containing protein n=1 Tax=Bifidobacterium xylocopae TaxID=2493119 RepID=A0A366KDK4_9BIFI|nr:DUF4391 domain-containing protein [Bifidobacterium xylocopae]RBP99784.1 hypothetical protein CRD59_01730 [Bifidobacterium xylocopae]